ncbi:PIN domain nuclease [Nocardia sp. NBC_00881]|uniref:PIN domain nuclease n=1 Tax=Nocardia sp. NBC_00881 TaxID=2975995 RepID=UPI00386A3672|nr:PIN domain nuclease [Nocardia sp. NBC_00881]
MGVTEQPVFLADKSAHAQRYTSDEAARRLDEEIAAGRLAVCEIIVLELLYSARNSSDYLRVDTALEALPWIATDNAAMRRALDIQRQLAQRGQHRRPLPDLIIAATAELAGLTVLHYDHDFDIIADLTGQPTEWIVPRGTGG